MSKSGMLFLLLAVTINPAAYSQTVIDVNASTATTVDANQTSGSPVTVNVSGSAVLSGSPGIQKTDGGDLIINFNDAASINAAGTGVIVSNSLVSLTINSSSSADPVITTMSNGIGNNGGISGNLINHASLSVDISGFRIIGDVVGLFNNAGDIRSNAGATNGINISQTVGNGFTNSGHIGSDGVGRFQIKGIRLGGLLTGDFENNGAIFSLNNGIRLDRAGTSMTGNFTNTGSINSSQFTAIQVDGAVGGSFTNTGAILSGTGGGDNGILISGTVGAGGGGTGFTNSGTIGTSGQRVGGSGILINGTVTGDFLNDTGGDIFSTNLGISLQSDVTMSFTNNASIDVINDDGILISGGVGGTFENGGSIMSGDNGIFISGNGVGSSFENNGPITSGNNGIFIGGDGAGDSFQNTGSIMAVGDGIFITGDGVVSSFENTASITSDNVGIFIGGDGVGGSFENSGPISSVNTGIFVSGNGVGDTFENSGTILSDNDSGIFIGDRVGSGFTNSGQIGSSAQRVAQRGIEVTEIVTGDFLNDTGGDIFSTDRGINLASNITGNFTNNALIDSLNQDAIIIGGSVEGSFTNIGVLSAENDGIRVSAAVGGSFENSGSILSDNGNGISVRGTVGSGFTNSGQLGTSAQRIGSQGIFIDGRVTGDFLNSASIFATDEGIRLNAGATSVTGNLINFGGAIEAGEEGVRIQGDVGGHFTNSGTVISTGEGAIRILGTVLGNFTNTSNVTGDTVGVRLGGLGPDSTFSNEGTISGTDDDGVEITLTGAGNRTLNNTGTITGNSTAIDVNSGGIAFINSGSVNGNVDLEIDFPHNVTLDSSGAVNGFLEMGDNPANTVTFTGTGDALFSEEVTDGIRNEGDLNLLRALIKEGTGQWTIDQDLSVEPNTTIINEGALLIEADTQLTSINGVIVNNTGALGGDGTISGAVTINSGGVLAPGASPGTITLNSDLTLNAGAVLDYELDTSDVAGGRVNDLTVVNGDLILDGVLNITDLGAFAEGSYTLIQVDGAITDNGLEIGTLPAEYHGSITVTANAVILNVIFQPIPEEPLIVPIFGHGGLLLLMLGMLLLAWFAFRREGIAKSL